MEVRHFAGAGGVRLVADVAGPPDGPAVILIHGGGQTRHSWGETVDALAQDGFLAVNLDMRGHGESGWAPDADYTAGVLADDIRAIAAELARPVALVGASMGGRAALLAAGEDPAVDCSGLILVDVTPRMSDDGRQQVVDFMRGGLDGFATLEDAAAAVSRYLPHRPPVKDTRGLAKNLRRGEDGRWRWHWDPALVDPARLRRFDDDPTRYETAAANVTAPLLLVRGGSSELVEPEHARAFLAVAPRAEYVEVGRARHMVAGDRNRDFSDAVRGFLRRALVS
ncbi:alpha/beta hydrolase [Amycolatopsis acidicola]|uniref:Alpha/beta hydrolase n=1 Tax=Amycolatopsis acidicola TaxID=2596893 RepID=A0A5N0UZ43_9PSEU|nr:alpha/beta fold hydrolase [Amycolatopsis acidicola]KAA9156789.1 alpha/beta hydrolase [Amycolatopsis acidicola]